MNYNTMYERLVDQGDNTIQGYVAYCLYKHGKREWIRQFQADNNRDPSDDELRGYVSSYTPQPLSALQTQAASILAAFADDAVENAKPTIVEDTLRGSTTKAIWQSILSNAIYTMILIALVFILKYSGVDILGIFKST